VNLILAGLLGFAPASFFKVLHLPKNGGGLYRYVLAGVLLGIGLALLLPLKGAPGLTLPGAIVINLCGAGALGIWLLLTPSRPMGMGGWVLWAVVVTVIGLAVLELLQQPWGMEPNNGREGD
jgi:hypothetical protein